MSFKSPRLIVMTLGLGLLLGERQIGATGAEENSPSPHELPPSKMPNPDVWPHFFMAFKEKLQKLYEGPLQKLFNDFFWVDSFGADSYHLRGRLAAEAALWDTRLLIDWVQALKAADEEIKKTTASEAEKKFFFESLRHLLGVFYDLISFLSAAISIVNKNPEALSIAELQNRKSDLTMYFSELAKLIIQNAPDPDFRELQKSFGSGSTLSVKQFYFLSHRNTLSSGAFFIGESEFRYLKDFLMNHPRNPWENLVFVRIRSSRNRNSCELSSAT